MPTENSEFVSVPVPPEHVTAVYELIAERERGNQDATGEQTTQPEMTEDLARRIYDESWDSHKKLLEYLADHEETWVPTSEIAADLSLTNGSRSLAGSLGAFGRRANNRYDGKRPFESTWDHGLGQAKHRMRSEVAAWIRDAAS